MRNSGSDVYGPSLPEVAGEAGELVDPESTEDIARGLFKVIENSDLRAQMIRKGLERVKKFTWDETARKTAAVYSQFGSARGAV